MSLETCMFLLYFAAYRLVIVCSNEEENRSYILSRLHNFRRSVNPRLVIDDCRKYLQNHFIPDVNMETDSQTVPTSEMYASSVDPEK